MAKTEYDWENGAELKAHTARKLKILRGYFEQYLRVRCRIPQQTRFKFAIVDGFAGGGRYKNGEPGSPVIFLEILDRLSREINVTRAAQGMPALEFGCRFIVNDAKPNVMRMLQENLAPLLAAAKERAPHLVMDVKYMNLPFEQAYPQIRESLLHDGFKNVLFNLDQCGDINVHMATLKDILETFRPSCEIFLTFAIQTLLTYLQRNNRKKLQARLRHLDLNADNLAPLDRIISKDEWLGTAEKIVFDSFQSHASFVSPFSLNNPEGWRYWLIHFSNVHRARQVYNDVLHANASHQVHFGRSGLSLNMFAFDPDKEGKMYLFKQDDRNHAKNELAEDIPRLIERSGDTMSVSDFYESAYNLTPAHSDDIKSAMFLNPDLEVLTPAGCSRRKPHTITVNDTLQLQRQKSFHILWKS